jgi:hypothetical protein
MKVVYIVFVSNLDYTSTFKKDLLKTLRLSVDASLIVDSFMVGPCGAD